MKRRLYSLTVAFSLLLSLAATLAWAVSHARPSGWHLIATAHSADLTRVDAGGRSALFTTTANWSTTPNHGFWDAWWARSRSGRLSLLAQVIDYEGTLLRVYASPPSLVVDVPGQPRPQALTLDRMREAGPGETWLGFARQSDAGAVDGASGPVGARAWMVTVPYWIVVLLGLPMPLRWLRAFRRRAVGRAR